MLQNNSNGVLNCIRGNCWSHQEMFINFALYEAIIYEIKLIYEFEMQLIVETHIHVHFKPWERKCVQKVRRQ